MTDLHALIRRMADELDHCRQLLTDDRSERHPPATEARAALAEPQEEGPTDQELIEEAIAVGLAFQPQDELEEVFLPFDAEEDLNEELIAFARAVLARWGRPTLPPIPVAERLPGPEDCDAEGRCWWLTLDWEAPALWEQSSTVTHWLHAHALPLSASKVQA